MRNAGNEKSVYKKIKKMSIVVSQKGWLIRLIEIQLKLKKWN